MFAVRLVTRRAINTQSDTQRRNGIFFPWYTLITFDDNTDCTVKF